MRLLVFDEALSFSFNSVQTLCLNLLPALSQFCEILVWVVPNYLHPEFANRIHDAPRLLLEGHNWPRWSVRCLPQRLLRKANPSLIGKVGQAAARSLRDARIRALAKKYRCTHFLTSCIFYQAMPDVALPVFGFVCDINPAMPEEARVNIARWVAKAQGIFGISEFTRQELQRAHPPEAEKIHAVPLAAPEFKNWNPKPPAARKFDFYYPAIAVHHKNHLVLFQACVALARLGLRFRLALSGAGIEGLRVNGGFTNPKMEEARRFLRDHASVLDHSVEVIGEVSLVAVDALYEDTRSVVLPSAYEGFGFPLAEAIHRGLPVICSDIPAFREQLATSGRLGNVQIVPANDAVSLAAAMKHFLKCAPDAHRNRKSGADVRRRTWQDAAQRCIELLSIRTAKASENLHANWFD
jgi:glycosyltransferase involved in cell wall biosynthesis